MYPHQIGLFIRLVIKNLKLEIRKKYLLILILQNVNLY